MSVNLKYKEGHYKRALALLLILWLAPALALAGKIYRWQDERGHWHFSDRPPPAAVPKPPPPPPPPLPPPDPKGPFLGMSQAEIIALLGEPSFVYRSPDATRVRLVYGNDFFFLVDDALTAAKPYAGVRRRARDRVVPGLSYDDVIDTWGIASSEQHRLGPHGVETTLEFKDHKDAIRVDRVYLEKGVVVRVELAAE